MRDSDWLVPSLILTAISGLIALVLIPSMSGIMPAVAMLPFWMMAAAVTASFYGFALLARARVRSPARAIADFARDEWRTLLILAVGLGLAGINMTTFMWTKPLLNHLVPFTADPALAAVDRLLFLGHDPWALLGVLNASPLAYFYHHGWFAMMILTVVIVAVQPPSPTSRRRCCPISSCGRWPGRWFTC